MLALGVAARGQTADPAYEPFNRAYESLRARAYEDAVASFRQAIQLAPERAAIHKDLGYTYIKVGENVPARDEFRRAMELDPADSQVALEFAFLAYETKQQAEARRVFDRIRTSGGPSAATAERAFQNIDRALAEGIARWQQAIAGGSGSFSAHFELATLAEQRDELALAAENYEKAWRLLPDRRSVLVDLGRVWKAMDRPDAATAALLAASRGGEARAAEMARELLPDRYPYVSEFQAATQLDAANTDLRRELAFLLLRMDREQEAEEEFRQLLRIAPGDLLSATQLGFLLYGSGDKQAAQPLFDQVLAGGDEDLANRVRAVLRVPQVLRQRPDSQASTVDTKDMAERSIRAGYLKDALRYLQIAHETDPGDFDVMLRMGWTLNMLHDDAQATRWFDLSRRSPDPQVAAEAGLAWRNLYDGQRLFRISLWLYPMVSTRWSSFFSYGQVKAELRQSRLLQPYVSVRLDGDSPVGASAPAGPLSESSLIVAGGVRTASWHRMSAWAEAGSAIGYRTGNMLPDYRGGLSGQWQKLPESSGWFADTSVDGLYVSRFDKDWLLYSQSRFGYVVRRGLQVGWHLNGTVDSKGQYWANVAETGPGVRVASRLLPKSMWVGLSLLRGAYLTNLYNPRRPNFTDFRVGVWYGFATR